MERAEGASYWLGKRLGFTTAPQVMIGQLESGQLPAEPRLAYREERYLVVRCANRQRRGWKASWLKTQDAIGCQGRLIATSVTGSVLEEDIVFCGVPPQAPMTEVSLRTNDDRYHVPILSRVTEWVPHHTLRGTKLQPGVYLLGAKFFAGLTDAVRLPAGVYFIRVLLSSRNGPPVEWESSTPEIVPDRGPREDDIILSLLPSHAFDVEWLNSWTLATRVQSQL